jgi:hypothetical protein
MNFMMVGCGIFQLGLAGQGCQPAGFPASRPKLGRKPLENQDEMARGTSSSRIMGTNRDTTRLTGIGRFGEKLN